MRKGFKQNFINWGATVLGLAALAMLLFFCFFRFGLILTGIRKLLSILAPILFGVVIAYVLSPAYNMLRRWMKTFLHDVCHWEGKRSVCCADILAMLLTFLFAAAIISGLIALIVPQLIVSIKSIIAALPSNLLGVSQQLQHLLASNPDLEANAMSLYAQAVNYVEQWIQNSLAPSMQDALSYVSVGVMSTVTFVKNLFIGIIVAIYLLSGKEHFLREITRGIYALFGIKWGNIIMEESRYAHQVFSGFIGGKIVDSAIIFVICAILLPILGIPYAMLISVIVGVTNIIPFFGPFIGAIPSFLIVLMDSPIKALYFLVFVLILQQFDGNILGPKILGNSTGLSSFWVLFSILLFSGLFGFVGMLIGVPVFAVLHHIIGALMHSALSHKNLPTDTMEYVNFDYMDSTGQVVQKKILPEDEQLENALEEDHFSSDNDSSDSTDDTQK